jgi:hypothetical protein
MPARNRNHRSRLELSAVCNLWIGQPQICTAYCSYRLFPFFPGYSQVLRCCGDSMRIVNTTHHFPNNQRLHPLAYVELVSATHSSQCRMHVGIDFCSNVFALKRHHAADDRS